MTMIRVRKNAEQLSPKERNSFLAALAQWKKVPGLSHRPTRFEEFFTIHSEAAQMGIHSFFGSRPSNFLAIRMLFPKCGRALGL